MTSAMDELDDPYARYLGLRRQQVFYLKPYSGNAGDALIRRGTEEALARLAIRQTVDPREADVLVMPGGNVSMWPTIQARVWRELWEAYPDKAFVIGPSGLRGSYTDWADAIVRHGIPVTAVFARDPISYRVLENAGLPSSIEIGLSPDPALYLRDSEWLDAHWRAATEEHTLIALRDDQEGLRDTAVSNRLRAVLPGRVRGRIAKLEASFAKRRAIRSACQRADGNLPVLVQDASKQNVDLFIETVRRARDVHTNRLHVMLLAVMLGKKVFAYEAAHDKLANVYSYSLEGWADVTFV